MQKTKKLSISQKDKKEIIDAVSDGESYDIIKEKFKLNSSSNISVIIKNKDKYLEAYNSSVGSPLRKNTKFKEIDEGLKNFIANSCNNGIAINDNILKVKSLNQQMIVNSKILNLATVIYKILKRETRSYSAKFMEKPVELMKILYLDGLVNSLKI